MPRARHYVNPKETGVPCFVTTTALDFAHVFHRPEIRDEMVRVIARECRLARAALYAYVVMPHHIHMIVRPHETKTTSHFMNVFKRESSRTIMPLLTPAEIARFGEQRGLNGNTFWQRSFSSIVITSEAMAGQKAEYIHQNPVRAGYAETPEAYRWSSASLYLQGVLDEAHGLELSALPDSLKPEELGDCERELGEA